MGVCFALPIFADFSPLTFRSFVSGSPLTSLHSLCIKGLIVPQRHCFYTTYISYPDDIRLSLTITYYILKSIYSFLFYNSMIVLKYAFLTLGVTIHIHLLHIVSPGIIIIHGVKCISSQHSRHSYFIEIYLILKY